MNKYTYKNIILYKVKSSLIFTSLFTNILLCLNLACLIIKPFFFLEKQSNLNLSVELFLFSKKSNIKQAFSQVELKLFINSSVHLQPYLKVMEHKEPVNQI